MSDDTLSAPRSGCGALSEGFGDFTTNDFEEITGHPARSYETFARDFAQAFAPAGAPAP